MYWVVLWVVLGCHLFLRKNKKKNKNVKKKRKRKRGWGWGWFKTSLTHFFFNSKFCLRGCVDVWMCGCVDITTFF